jgi:hypothetical protein
MIKYFSQFEYVRLWTFTCTTRHSISSREHFNVMRKAWRIFTKELRRNKALRESQRNVQYIKTVELHKSGFVHFHALFTQYVPQSIIGAIWDGACRAVLKQNTHVASAYVSAHRHNAKRAAMYVTKNVAKGTGNKDAILYVTKADEDFKKLSELGKKVKRWSKSGKAAIFEKKESNGKWIIAKVRSDGSLNLCAVGAIEHVPENDDEISLEDAVSQIEFGFGSSDPPDFLKEIIDYID